MLSNEAVVGMAIVAAVLFAGGLGFYLWRAERARREALARLAERRRWSVEIRPASFGAGVRLRLTPRERATWDCRVVNSSRGSSSGTQSGVRKTEFEDATVQAQGGSCCWARRCRGGGDVRRRPGIVTDGRWAAVCWRC